MTEDDPKEYSKGVMKQHTQAQINQFLETKLKLYVERKYNGEPEIYVSKDYVSVEIPGSEFTYDNLLKIAEFFGTTNINIVGQSEEGCPTCGPTRATRLEIRK